ncbi:MAG: hypothetical protein D6732_19075 [Methanobacteriota archaeon]|nr:MAG: hypothetical protein D6732_19075 [Euryarchaeota archaeon]
MDFTDPKFLEAYKEARNEVKNLFGDAPEDYMVALFLDSNIYDSVLLQTNQAGTPHALISTNELELLQELKNHNNLVPNGRDLFLASRKARIYMPATRFSLSKDSIKAKLVQLLSMALLAEKTESTFPSLLEQIYRKDAIIKELFANNVFELVKERSAPWAWQYFQDFVASLRVLSLYGIEDFYIPPASMRKTSVFYNFLLEIKQIVQERTKLEKRMPLWELTLHGFGHYALRKYLETLNEDIVTQIKPDLKGNLGQPFGEVGFIFLQWLTELEENEGKSVFDIAKSIKNDYELVKHWKRSETKQRIENYREVLSEEALVWHSFRNGYWADLWPIRAQSFDKVANLVGKIQRNKISSRQQLLMDKPAVKAHGRVKLPDKDVAVFSINEDAIGQEQMIILRNHLLAEKNGFITPLPGLPDIIIFKKFAGMHIAAYLGVKTGTGYPTSPYDLPLVSRAVQVTRKKDAYISDVREDEGKLAQTVDYSELKDLTEPQHRAIRYLIKQGEVVQ